MVYYYIQDNQIDLRRQRASYFKVRKNIYMTAFIQGIASFTTGTTVAVYLFIFCGKIIEVTLGTFSQVLINKGIRLVGILVGVVEYTLWLLITTSVMIGYKDDPIKILFLISASAIGKYLGSMLDEKMALGLSNIQVFLPDGEEADQVAQLLKDNGFGMTILHGEGVDGDKKHVLLLTLKRKRCKEATSLINGFTDNAVITVSQVSSFMGGYLKKGSAKYPSLMGKFGSSEEK